MKRINTNEIRESLNTLSAGDEILLSDSVAMSKRLDFYGVKNRLYVKEGMWHAYQLYSLKSCEDDFKEINKFLFIIHLINLIVND